MKKTFFVYSAILSFIIMVFVGQTAMAAEFIKPDQDGNLTVSNQGKEYKNLYTFGSNVLINSQIKGDLVLAGGTVNLEQPVENDLIIAGGTININAPVGGDVRVAGGTVYINAPVGGDVIALAGTLTASDKAVIGGDFISNGGNVSLNNEINGSLKINAESLVLNGVVKGYSNITATRTISFGPKANVANGIYKSPTQANVENGAQVSNVQYEQLKVEHRAKAALTTLITMAFIGKLLAIFFAAWVLSKLFAKTTNNLIANMNNDFWKNLGIGFVGLFVLPIAALIGLITIVGTYLAVMVFIAWIMVLLVAGILACVYTGAYINKRLSKHSNLQVDWQSILIGSVVVGVVYLIPILGFLAVWVLLMWAFGAVLKTIYLNMHNNQAAETEVV